MHRYDKETNRWVTSYRPLKSDKDAAYHFEMQSKDRTYQLNTQKIEDPFVSDKPLVRIHDSGLSGTCLSCEG